MLSHQIGEFSVFLRKAFKQTSKGLDYAIEYEVDGSTKKKIVTRQDFRSMFRRALKKSRTNRTVRSKSDSNNL